MAHHATHNVLLVDDDVGLREVIAAMLTDLGHTVTQAANGLEAFAQLSLAPDQCIVLLDIDMPLMNGIEFLEELAKHPLKDMPVVVVSARALRPGILGGRRQLKKPVTLAQLLELVERCGSHAEPS